MHKLLTCATLVTDGNGCLLVHPTCTNFWETPKGLREEMEEVINTCCRELKEETNIELTSFDLYKVPGIFEYTSRKDVAVCVHHVEEPVDISELYCSSTFFNPIIGGFSPEIDCFYWANWKEVEEMVRPEMWNVIEYVKENYL